MRKCNSLKYKYPVWFSDHCPVKMSLTIGHSVDDRSTQRAVLQKAVLQWLFAGQIDPVLCVAGKMKYICSETF